MSGLLHRVWVDLRCERCGKLHETDIRFHNYLISYEGPDYKLGEHVTDPYMIIGETYEGNADRYCRPCYHKWTEAQSLLGYESLADLIEQGTVSARDKQSGVTLTKEDVREYGRRYTDEEITKSACLLVTGPFFEELDLFLNNELVVDELELLLEDKPVVGVATWSNFLGLHAPLVERKLIEAGWKSAELTYEDFNIYLDEDRRLVVTDLECGGLTPLWY